MTDLLANTSLVGFYALGFVAIFASLRVIMLANPVHAILSMIVSLLALAGIFFILGAPFAGALQVIVYAGAILVLFVFVIMMLNLGITTDARESRWLAGDVWAVPAGLTLIIGVVLFAMLQGGVFGQHETIDHASAVVTTTALAGTQTVSAKAVGTALFTQYVLLVEVAAMLLLAALVAAYHLGKKALDDENLSHNSQRRQILLDEAGSIAEYDNADATDAVEYAKPYTYQSVNPHLYKKSSSQTTRNAKGQYDG